MRNRRIRLVLPLAAMVALALGGCSKNPASPLLQPSGQAPELPGSGVLSGTLDFGTPGVYPRTLILIAKVKPGKSTSPFSQIQIMGTMATPNWDFSVAPRLTQLAPSVWVDTVTVPAGDHQWKFALNGSWGQTPYSTSDASRVDGLANTLAFDGSPDHNLRASVSAGDAGLYVCTLDETTSPASYKFVEIASSTVATFSSTADGRFTLTGLTSGTYNVLIRPAGLGTRTITGIVIAEGQGPKDLGVVSVQGYTITASAGPNGSITPLGPVFVAPGGTQRFSIRADAGYQCSAIVVDGAPQAGDTTYTFTNVQSDHTLLANFGPAAGTAAITGSVAFDPGTFPDMANPPYPPVTVRLYLGANPIDTVTTSRSDPSFSFTGLASGTYRVTMNASVFLQGEVQGIAVTTAPVDIGTIPLTADPNAISASIHVAGDFNNFTIGDTTACMQTALGVWSYTPSHPITAGTYNLKYVVNGSFSNPAYGGDESVTLTVPAGTTGAPTELVTGFGTALHVLFPGTGNYTFGLDERRQAFTISGPTAPAARPDRSAAR